MDTAHYDATPEMRRALGYDAEAVWDQRAEHYNAALLSSGALRSDEIVTMFYERGLLRGKTVLDVGGGTGRYAIPFARSASHVTITDISSNMLSHAKDNAEREGLFNLSYRRLDWESADLDLLGWKKAFDFVFASMCPAARSKEGIERMSAASCGWCALCQVIYSRDPLVQFLRNKLRPNRTYEMQNDREIIPTLFNRLWNQGYEPELSYVRRSDESSCSVEEAAVRYAGRFGLAAREQGADLTALIRAYASGGEVRLSSKSTLAILLWKASGYETP